MVDSLGRMLVLGESIRSPLDWVKALERGLPTASVDSAVERGIVTREEIDEYLIPRRTLAHRRQKNLRLTLEESDRLSRIARITAKAVETFGSQSAGVEWLRKSNGGLGGSAPLKLLRSGEGAILVEEILTRIDHGVYT